MEIMTEESEPVVGVRLIDCDHREMAEAIMELQSAAEGGMEQSRTARLLRALSHFTLTHFAMEEAMMSATKYPLVALHRLRHQRMMEQLRQVAAIQNRGKQPLRADWLAALADWHNLHVRHDDSHFGHWVNREERR